ncbi:MAG: Lrp/AsnC family transcriptional regulator [Aeromicrobium sp.]|uniref:Lrp/AsnC family transcriptional regulator n=1 Tax=Aeromicrobium sp. TaxID=1871063 RepID=UPI003C3CB1FE
MANDVLDEVDRRIVDVLRRTGRLPNNALAERVGVAPSTCLTRLRALVDRGVISGFHAQVEPAWIGRPIEAMIAVRLRAEARASIAGFFDRVAVMEQVQNVYYLAGADDFHLHVAVEGTDELRSFVTDGLSTQPEVARTETNLIFAHRRGGAA